MKEKILMCPPDYFTDIDYAINPWMKVGTACNTEEAKKEWQMLKEKFESLGAEVKVMDPQPNLPDLVFTANAALVYENKAVISKFRFPERTPEEEHYANWFRENGYDVHILPDEINFEGAGDALFSGDTLYSGYIPRTDITAHKYISDLLGIRIISLELVDKRFYHLDTCFCPLTDGYLIYFPGAFDDYANKVIESNFPEEKRIPVTDEEASKFSCNSVCLGQNVVMNLSTDRLREALREKGFTQHQLDMKEFLKSGGSSKCLSLKLVNYKNLPE